MSKILVTGGCGMIGSHLVDRLLDLGHSVDVIDNLSTGKSHNIFQRDYNKKTGQIDQASLYIQDIRTSSIGYYDCIFHLAALPQVQYSIDNLDETNDVNLNGTLNVLKCAERWGVKKVIFASSSAIYSLKSPYAVQKYAAENYCKLYNDLYNLPTVSLRFFNVYGPRQSDFDNSCGVIARFKRLKKEGKKAQIFGDGSNTRDFIHVYDVVDALIKAMEVDCTEFTSFDIGTGVQTSIKEVAELIGVDTEYLPSRSEVSHTKALPELAEKALDWKPKISIKDGLCI